MFLEFLVRLQEIRQALVDLEAMFEIFSQKIEIKDKNNAKKLNITNSNIEFNNVHFSYNPDRLILSNFSYRLIKILKSQLLGKLVVENLQLRDYYSDFMIRSKVIYILINKKLVMLL